MDKQADAVNSQMTHRTLQSKSIVMDMSQSMKEDKTVIKSLATQGKRHVDKAVGDRWVTTNMAKTLAQHFNRPENVENAPRWEPRVHKKSLCSRHSRSQSCSCIINPALHSMTETPTLTIPAGAIDVLQVVQKGAAFGSFQ